MWQSNSQSLPFVSPSSPDPLSKPFPYHEPVCINSEKKELNVSDKITDTVSDNCILSPLPPLSSSSSSSSSAAAQPIYSVTSPETPIVKGDTPLTNAPYKTNYKALSFQGSSHILSDRRGLPPLTKRWRLYCFQNAFIIEPNIPGVGIQYNYKNFGIISTTREGDQYSSHSSSNILKNEFCNKHKKLFETSMITDPPQLIIFRHSDVIVEVPNSTHQLYKQFGTFDCLFLIDALIGQLHIADAKFLVVIVESEGVAGFCKSSFQKSKDVSTPSYTLTNTRQMDSFIYRIKRACLIPFHLSFEYLQYHPINEQIVNSSFNHGHSGIGCYYNGSMCQQPLPTMSDGSIVLQPKLSRSKSVNSLDLLIQSQHSPIIETPIHPTHHHLFSSMSSISHPLNDPTMNSSLSHIPLSSNHTPVVSSNPVIFKEKEEDPLLLHVCNQLCVSSIPWYEHGFGDQAFCNLLGEKLSVYKQNIEKLLSTTFYYSYDIEITHTLQRKRLLNIPFESQLWPCHYSRTRVCNKTSSSLSHNPVTSGTEQCVINTNPLTNEHNIPKSSSMDIRFMDIGDTRFIWNKQLSQPFLAWSIDSRWLIPIIQGSVTSATLTFGNNGLDIILLCRRSCLRAGTRYNHRGIDDLGHVANFNESEQLLSPYHIYPNTTGPMTQREAMFVTDQGWASFVQIRGSVPLFWEQTGSIAINPTPQLTREIHFATNAFFTHQNELYRLYGPVTYINLLSHSKGGEHKLSRALEFIIKEYSSHYLPSYRACHISRHQSKRGGLYEKTASLSKDMLSKMEQTTIDHIHWDFHQHIKLNGFEDALNAFILQLRPILKSCGYYCDQSFDSTTASSTIQLQKGIIRTNCLDCLDRTNAFQWFLCWSWINSYLKQHDYSFFLNSGLRVSQLTLQSGIYLQELTNRLIQLDHNIKQQSPSHEVQSPLMSPHSPSGPDTTSIHPVQQLNTAHLIDDHLASAMIIIPNTIKHHPYIHSTLHHLSTNGDESSKTMIRSNVIMTSPINTHMSQSILIRYFGGDDGIVSLVYRTRIKELKTTSQHHECHSTIVDYLTDSHRSHIEPFSDIMTNRLSSPTQTTLSLPRSIIVKSPALSMASLSSQQLSHSNDVCHAGGTHPKITDPYTVPKDISGGDYIPNILKDIVSRMWADHGDHISRAYTGTDSVMSSLIRQGKSSLSTNMGHMMTSLGRFYQNTFEDSARQDAIELLLNEHNHLSQPYITQKPTESALHYPTRLSIDESMRSPICDTDPTHVPSSAKDHSDTICRNVTTTPRHNINEQHRALDHKMKPSIDHTVTTKTATLRIWFGTWNLGGHRVNESLDKWLLSRQTQRSVADIYVIAIQELVELTGMRVLLSQNDKDKEWQLELNIRHALGEEFKMLRSHSLVGLYLVVFVRITVKHLISQVHISELKLGFKGQMGNKGAVLLRLSIGNSSFCFINVHLSSGIEKAQQRRAQLQAVLDAAFSTRPVFLARQHDCVLLGGDFNFRCDVDPRQAETWLDSGLWRELLFRDQYITGKRLGLLPFKDILEGPIRFLPTYKFRRGTNLFDRGRSPGWCDRILYTGDYARCILTQKWIECIAYDRIDEFLSSDHKPVFALFKIKIELNSNVHTKFETHSNPLSSSIVKNNESCPQHHLRLPSRHHRERSTPRPPPQTDSTTHLSRMTSSSSVTQQIKEPTRLSTTCQSIEDISYVPQQTITDRTINEHSINHLCQHEQQQFDSNKIIDQPNKDMNEPSVHYLIGSSKTSSVFSPSYTLPFTPMWEESSSIIQEPEILLPLSTVSSDPLLHDSIKDHISYHQHYNLSETDDIPIQINNIYCGLNQ